MNHVAERISFYVEKLEELCVAGGILGIAALTVANVLARSLLGRSIVYAEEVSQFLMVLVTFVGLGYAAAKGRHIRMTALTDALPSRARKALMLLVTSTTAALLFVLAYLGVDYAAGTVRVLGSVSPALRVPLWIVYLAAPLGFGLAGLQYALAFAKNLIAPGVWIAFDHEDAPSGSDEPPAAAL